MEPQVIENCQLEWQVQRGVLYVHNKDTGATVLRISGLLHPNRNGQLKDGCIDIGLNMGQVHISYPRD